MSYTTFLIGYGDHRAAGRGIYSVNITNNKLTTKLVFNCAPKPGAMIVQGDRVYLSYQGDHQSSGIFVFSFDEEYNLTLLSQHEIPVFITCFSTINRDYLLGSSFYDAVDVVLNITNPFAITSAVTHTFRPRSEDKRQAAPHPHHIKLMDDGLHVYSVDMGTDLVSLYSLENNQLNLLSETVIDSPLGSGPRILCMRRDNRFAYLLHEIVNDVAVYALSDVSTPTVQFTEIQRISTRSVNGNIENSAAGCVLTEDDAYLLVTNRGENTLVLFSIDATSGELTFCDRINTGLVPRDIAVIGHQIVVAAQSSNQLQLFEIDARTNTLRLLDEKNGVIAPVAFSF